MLYTLQNNVLDLNKLEMLSKILFWKEDKNKPYFRFSINGYTWDSEIFNNEESANIVRNNLLKAWIEVKGDNL